MIEQGQLPPQDVNNLPAHEGIAVEIIEHLRSDFAQSAEIAGSLVPRQAA